MNNQAVTTCQSQIRTAGTSRCVCFPVLGAVKFGLDNWGGGGRRTKVELFGATTVDISGRWGGSRMEGNSGNYPAHLS